MAILDSTDNAWIGLRNSYHPGSGNASLSELAQRASVCMTGLCRGCANQDDWDKALLLRRSIWDSSEYAYYLTWAPCCRSDLETLAKVAGRRWENEIAFQAAKGECGLDDYEVRHWHGWYRHITLAMLAHAVLAVLRSRGGKTLPGQVRLSVPEARHLLTRQLWRGWHGLEHFLH